MFPPILRAFKLCPRGFHLFLGLGEQAWFMKEEKLTGSWSWAGKMLSGWSWNRGPYMKQLNPLRAGLKQWPVCYPSAEAWKAFLKPKLFPIPESPGGRAGMVSLSTAQSRLQQAEVLWLGKADVSVRSRFVASGLQGANLAALLPPRMSAKYAVSCGPASLSLCAFIEHLVHTEY